VNGCLRLRAGVGDDGQTVLRECFAGFPLQVGRPRLEARGRLSLVVLLQSGGLLDGDSAAVSVHVEAGARLALRTQAATQIHAGCSRQSLEVVVERGGAFSYVPNALVPHASADLTSATRIRMEPGARVLVSESLSPGRVEFGEAFAYVQVRLALDAWCGSALVARERALIRPDVSTREAQFGRMTHVATAYVLGSDSPFLRNEALEVSDLARGGWFVRGLAQRASDLDCALSEVTDWWWSGG
jgi:urease accessory protein UreH